MNPVQQLNRLGQSVWLDYIRRAMLDDGTLAHLIEQDGISGLTSNPSIFHKAIADSDDYDATISTLAGHDLDNEALYERLAVEDLQRAADLLEPVYRRTAGADGYVSLEVSPRLAYDTEATLAAARRLWRTVDRSNLMIKVPATPQGLPAFETLIAEGINVNVTLLFSLDTYEQVAQHYLAGLERAIDNSLPPAQCASVASFFLSRIDAMVDPLIARRLDESVPGTDRQVLAHLPGRVAVSCARLAYQRWQRLFSGERWAALAARGARPQRLLWASTSTKNPAYSDLLYVESLVGPDTVNTLPPATLDALRDHGQPLAALQAGIAEAEQDLATLDRAGIDLRLVTDQLLDEGVEKFDQAYRDLLAAVAQERRSARTTAGA